MKKKIGAFGAGQFSLGTLAGGRPGTTIFQNPGGGGGAGGCRIQGPGPAAPPCPGARAVRVLPLRPRPSPRPCDAASDPCLSVAQERGRTAAGRGCTHTPCGSNKLLHRGASGRRLRAMESGRGRGRKREGEGGGAGERAGTRDWHGIRRIRRCSDTEVLDRDSDVGPWDRQSVLCIGGRRRESGHLRGQAPVLRGHNARVLRQQHPTRLPGNQVIKRAPSRRRWQSGQR